MRHTFVTYHMVDKIIDFTQSARTQSVEAWETFESHDILDMQTEKERFEPSL